MDGGQARFGDTESPDATLGRSIRRHERDNRRTRTAQLTLLAFVLAPIISVLVALPLIQIGPLAFGMAMVAGIAVYIALALRLLPPAWRQARLVPESVVLHEDGLAIRHNSETALLPWADFAAVRGRWTTDVMDAAYPEFDLWIPASSHTELRLQSSRGNEWLLNESLSEVALLEGPIIAATQPGLTEEALARIQRGQEVAFFGSHIVLAADSITVGAVGLQRRDIEMVSTDAAQASPTGRSRVVLHSAQGPTVELSVDEVDNIWALRAVLALWLDEPGTLPAHRRSSFPPATAE